MSRPTLDRLTGFVLRIPESWWEFDVWRATRTGDLARLVDARIATVPGLAPHRGVLLRLLRQAAEHAERHDAVFCAVATDTATDTADDTGTLVATAMVFHSGGAPDPAQNTAEAIAAQLTAVAAVPGSPAWRRVALVDLPAGRAVRVHGVEPTALGGGSVDTVVMQTILPVPGDRGVLNLVLTSPQTQLAEPLLDLFGAISDTLAWGEQI